MIKEVKPYSIHHLPLEDEQDFNLTYSKSEGHYLVLWWRCIALGELYIEPGITLTPNSLRKKILKAIDPAIEMYMSGKPPKEGTFKKAFLNQDHIIFKAGMHQIFSNFIPALVPPSSDISVIICTCNRSLSLKKCLESFENQRCRPLEIIVVDNNPEDDSTKLIVEGFPGVRYYQETKGGLDIARNSGSGIARGSIVAYTDDDVEPHPYWIYQVNETFNRTKAVAMTGLVIASELQTESQQLFEKHWSYNKGYTDKMFNHEYLDENLSNGPPVWEIGAGANMAFRKDVLREAGNFDERLDVDAAGCSGDAEMWFRILAKGGIINYNPRAIVFHAHRRELSSLKKQLFNSMKGFAAAALIQQSHNKEAGYSKYLYTRLPYQYLKLIVKGFPFYRSRYSTVFDELKGVLSGINYYRKNKKRG